MKINEYESSAFCQSDQTPCRKMEQYTQQELNLNNILMSEPESEEQNTKNKIRQYQNKK